MFNTIFACIRRLPIAAHFALTAAALIAFIGVKNRLDASYAASKHPVDYAAGQTTFDAGKIKQFYAHMTEQGTLDIYWQTQVIDFGFILAMALFGLLGGTLLARFSMVGGWARKAGHLAAILVVTGTCFDILENLVSFVMLSYPADFANWLALPYSGFASAKFAMITSGMFAAIASFLLIAFERLRPR